MTDLLFSWAQNSSLPLPVLHLGLLAGVKQIWSAFLTSFCLQIDEACPTQGNNPFSSVELCVCELEAGIVLMRASVETEEWQQDGCHPLVRKWVESQHFSAQLTPKTDGASEHCCAAPARTMATACTRQKRKPARPIREENALPPK